MLNATAMGLTLGALTLEQTKHLQAQHLADHLNVYLHDDDEYRAITRETILRGLGGTITYTAAAITVTLDQPSQPKIARALACLLAEINTRPPVFPGDLRPITYQLAT